MGEPLFDLFDEVLPRVGGSDSMLWTKANDIVQEEGSSTVSISCVARFKQRHGIALHRMHAKRRVWT